MVFSSVIFMGIFLPVSLILYFLAKERKTRNLILLLVSLVFYAWGEPLWIVAILLLTYVDFVFAKKVSVMSDNAGRKKFLAVIVAVNLSVLFVVKYFDFFVSSMNSITGAHLPLLHIRMPIGISFFTFQALSYVVDVYRGEVRPENPFYVGLYISFFPQLIAGPIVTYNQVEKELHSRKITTAAVLDGIGTFIFGLGLKVLLANPIGKLWSQVCAIGFESISTPLAWLAIVAFSFQIYFDFFGYSLMAVGLGKMLGFKLPENFDHPYLSLTMTEFWRRWHITLGSWFREYVYIPLGGNRKGKITEFRNLLIVWLLTGIWHGAGYNFLLWGAVLFVIIGIEKLFLGKFLNKYPSVGHIYMALIIPVTWTIFAVEDLGQLGIFLSRMFPFFFHVVWSVFRFDYLKYLKLYFPFLIAGVIFSTKLPYKLLKRIKNRTVIWVILAVIFAASVYCMYKGLDDPFLYFRF